MGYIHCCSGLRKTRTFVLIPAENYTVSELDVLSKCPVCGNYVAQLTRLDEKNNIYTLRYTNKRAKKFLKKIKLKILYEEKYINYSRYKGDSFYLNYNEFGVKKRCYSNLSSLKIGLNSTF